MRHLSFSELAFSVMNKYIKDDQIPSGDLRRIIVDSFAKFRSTGEFVQSLGLYI